MKKTYFVTVGLISALVYALLYLLGNDFPEYDVYALLIANTVLSLLSVVSYWLVRNKIRAERPQAFVNGVYSATLLRLMLCLAALFVYIYSTREQLHKPTIFAMMGMYLVYTMAESIVMSKTAKK